MLRERLAPISGVGRRSGPSLIFDCPAVPIVGRSNQGDGLQTGPAFGAGRPRLEKVGRRIGGNRGPGADGRVGAAPTHPWPLAV